MYWDGTALLVGVFFFSQSRRGWEWEAGKSLHFHFIPSFSGAALPPVCSPWRTSPLCRDPGTGEHHREKHLRINVANLESIPL